jgi:hypothetical protein
MMLADCSPISPFFLWPIFCLAYAATTLGFTSALVLACWRGLKGRNGQQVSRWQLCATLLLWGPIVLRLAVPCPIQGNYIGNLTLDTEDDYHTWVRFSDGRADFFSECNLRGGWCGIGKPWGRYLRTGWNTYVLTEVDPEPQPDRKPFPITLHAGWFFLKLNYALESRQVYKEDYLYRDCRFLRWIP